MAGTMILSNVSVGFADAKDYSGHWAAGVINKWSESGVIAGYPDGSFMPDKSLTRAELAAIINNIMSYQVNTPQSFSDVPTTEWFASVVNKLATAKVITGYDNQFRPNDKVTRQEAAVILANAFSIKASNAMFAKTFNDSASIDTWALSAVSALAEKKYVAGKNGNSFDPKASLTRAEAVQFINNIVGELKNKPGTYSGVYAGNVMVNVAEANLKDMIINGDLIVAPGVGNGNLTLDNVTVKGRLIAQGGGENSIVLTNSNIQGVLLVIKQDGKLRILAQGNSEISSVEMNSGGKLQEQGMTGKGFGNVEIMTINPGQPVTLDGNFDSVSIEVPNLQVAVTGGSIGTLTVAPEATNGGVTVSNATITNLTIQAKTAVDIQSGKVGTVTMAATAAGSTQTIGAAATVTNYIANTAIDIKGTGTIQTVTANVPGVTAPTAPTTTPGTTGGGSTGGTSNGSGNENNQSLVALSAGTATVNNAAVNGVATENAVTFNFASEGALSKVSLTSTPGSTLKITSVKGSNGTATTLDRNITDLSNISVSSLLGSTNPDVSLSTLKGALGDTVTINGVLSASGYTSRNVVMVMNLTLATVNSNDFAVMSSSGNTLTATLKPGKESVTVNSANPIDFISSKFETLGSMQIEEGAWINIASETDSAAYKAIADALLAEFPLKTFSTLTLGDLKEVVIRFKEAGKPTIYTLNIN